MVQKKKVSSPVFEMILDSMEGDTGVVHASPSSEIGDWQVDHQEGQLSVDVGDTKEELIVVSTMAGADTSKMEVYVHNDLLTLRGYRSQPSAFQKVSHIYHEECYWGSFSRTIVLPVDVKADLANAEYTNGVLIVRIPKRHMNAKIPVTIVEE